MPSLMESAQTAAERYKIDPAVQDYDESKGVAGRVNQIAGSGSPLMQLAETKGNQLAAQRGLTGSSLGIEAAQKSVLEAATPIATADASLFNNQALANQNAKNVASQSNQASGTTLANTALNQEGQSAMQDKSLMESARQFNAAQTQQQGQFTAAQEQQAKQFGITAGMTKEQIDNQVQQFGQQMGMTQQQIDVQKAQFASSQAQQAQQFGVQAGQTQQQIDAQKAQFGITAGMTQQQIANQVQQFGQQMGMTQQQIDNQKAQFGVTSGQTQVQLQQAQQQIDNQKAQFAAQLGMSVQDLDLRRDTLDANQQQFLKTLDQQQAQLAEQSRQFNASQASNQSMFQQELAQKGAQFGQTLEQQKMLAQMDVTSREKIAVIEAQFKTDIQGSVNISNAWGTMMQSIGNIQNNPNLEAGAKQTLVQNTLDSFQSFAAFWKKTSNVDISPLLNFNVVGSGAATPNNQSIAPLQPDQQYGYPGYTGGSGAGAGNGGAAGTGSSASIGASPGGFGSDSDGGNGSGDGGNGW